MNVHTSTYWRRNRLVHRRSSIHWTHPDSFGIFTKLNTSMCAADCGQGCTFTICFTPHPWPRSLLQGRRNNSGKKWSFHKSGGEISPVVCASAWLSDCCVLASAAQIHSPWKRIWQGSLPRFHPSKHACVRGVKPPSFNFHGGGMMCGSRAVTTALEGGRASRRLRERGREGGTGVAAVV